MVWIGENGVSGNDKLVVRRLTRIVGSVLGNKLKTPLRRVAPNVFGLAGLLYVGKLRGTQTVRRTERHGRSAFQADYGNKKLGRLTPIESTGG
ncbi:MAG: hypothetical protein ACI87E_000536 [Mariniblastus sp.]|jgi:hypothetical protein